MEMEFTVYPRPNLPIHSMGDNGGFETYLELWVLRLQRIIVGPSLSKRPSHWAGWNNE